jgi:hypothetical protein
LLSAVALAACGSSSKSSSGSGSGGNPTTVPTTPATLPVSNTYGTGVTADTIKIGIALIDFQSIAQYIHLTHGDEEKIDNVFIDQINKNGGINGKKLVAVYQKYVPIGSITPTQVCTAMTEDHKVFAILGNIEDPSGASQLCVSKTHHTILVGHDMTTAEINGASPLGLMSTPDIAAERRLTVMLNLMKQANTLQGKKVAILTETGSKSRATGIAVPMLKAMGVQTGTMATLPVGQGTDTTAAQTQLTSVIQRWKGEGVNSVLIIGADVVPSQFVDMIVKNMPGVQLSTDSESSAVSSAQDEVRANQNPNSYEGMYSVNGLTDQQQFEDPNLQKCIKTYEDATGETVVAPKDLKAGADNLRVQVWVGISDICRELVMFQQIATKAGKYLNNNSWVNAIDSLGHVNDLPSSQYATLKTNKYDSDDTQALAVFHAAANDFVPTGPMQDVANLG